LNEPVLSALGGDLFKFFAVNRGALEPIITPHTVPNEVNSVVIGFCPSRSRNRPTEKHSHFFFRPYKGPTLTGDYFRTKIERRFSDPFLHGVMRPDFRLTSAILKVGEGRGFVVKRRRYHDCIIITAAHCLPDLPPPHPCAYLEELTYRRLLGPLGTEPTVWAQLLFADPVADIAVLGTPDGQVLYEQADAYHALMASAHPLAIAEAPIQRDHKAAVGEARVLSLDGHWREGRVQRGHGWLAFSPEAFFEFGMSGSPIINMSGKAIGIVSVNFRSPALVHHLPTGLSRSIRGAPLTLRKIARRRRLI
jgi:hypothetical protein